MPPGLAPPLAVLASYLVGSVPFAWVVTRLWSGRDIRTVGSGNVGATNVARVLGRKGFVTVFALDAAKGAAAVLVLAPWAASVAGPASDATLLEVLCALAAVLGHVFPVYLRFRGGKGVATGAGVLASLTWLPTVCAFGVFGALLLAFRYVSLASMGAAVSLVPFAILFGAPLLVVAFCAVVALLVVLRHRPNIARIAAGAEPRVFQRREPHGS